VSDIAVLADQAVAVVGAAVAAYGAGVLSRAEDAAADATVSLGRRVLARIRRQTRQPEALDIAVADLAQDSGDPDAVAALRLQIRKVLTQDPDLVAELSQVLLSSSHTTASGPRSVAIGGDNHGAISTGDGSPISQQR
jgi:hypothetical protein